MPLHVVPCGCAQTWCTAPEPMASSLIYQLGHSDNPLHVGRAVLDMPCSKSKPGYQPTPAAQQTVTHVMTGCKPCPVTIYYSAVPICRYQVAVGLRCGSKVIGHRRVQGYMHVEGTMCKQVQVTNGCLCSIHPS